MLHNRFLLFLLIPQFYSIIYGSDPYGYKERENRREGRECIAPMSAPDLQLVSCIAYREKTERNSDVDLKIRFYLEKDTTVFITAKELNSRYFYKMSPIRTRWLSGWNEFGPWPTGDVLRPLGLLLNDIGLTGRICTKYQIGSGRIAPLIIYHSGLPEKISRYQFYFISIQDLEEVTYKIYENDRDSPFYTDKISMELYGGVPFPITVDLSDNNEGLIRMVLDCKYKNRVGGPQRTYTFYHKTN
jgi:hypothetical protein